MALTTLGVVGVGAGVGVTAAVAVTLVTVTEAEAVAKAGTPLLLSCVLNAVWNAALLPRLEAACWILPIEPAVVVMV